MREKTGTETVNIKIVSLLLSLPHSLLSLIVGWVTEPETKLHLLTRCKALYALTQKKHFWQGQVAQLSESQPINPEHPEIKQYAKKRIRKLQTYHALYKAIRWLNSHTPIDMLRRFNNDYAIGELVLKTPILRKRLLLLNPKMEKPRLWGALRSLDRAGPELSTYAFSTPEIRSMILEKDQSGICMTNIAQSNVAFARMLATDKELLKKAHQWNDFLPLKQVSRLTGVTFDFPEQGARIVNGVAVKYSSDKKENECVKENTATKINPS